MTAREAKSILVIVSGLLVLHLWLEHVYFLYAAAGIGIGSLLSIHVARGVLWLWFKIAEVLGYINSRVILGVIFYLFLTPISLVYRLFTKRTMIHRPQEDSTFISRDHTYVPKDLEHPW